MEERFMVFLEVPFMMMSGQNNVFWHHTFLRQDSFGLKSLPVCFFVTGGTWFMTTLSNPINFDCHQILMSTHTDLSYACMVGGHSKQFCKYPGKPMIPSRKKDRFLILNQVLSAAAINCTESDPFCFVGRRAPQRVCVSMVC